MQWAKHTNRWSDQPVIGAAVLYGTPADASHIGVVVRTNPLVLSVEGNTALMGYSREGVAVDLKLVALDRVVGYAYPASIG